MERERELQGLVLTPEQRKTRRQRNIAIAVAVGFLAVLFYVVTRAKFGAGGVGRPL